MIQFIALLTIVLCLCTFVFADLHSELTAARISAIFPGDRGYAQASEAYNLRFNLHPAAITFPTTLQQVSQIVNMGSVHNLSVVPRGGGHSYIASSLGGKSGSLVVDMSHFKDIQIDNSGSNNTIVGSGNRLGDVARILSQNGRALPHGTCPYVGIAGHTALGGFGFTSRLWGLALDPLVAINAVLANGTIIRATESSHSDLFWAMRGAAPSFGITTSLEFKTFPIPTHASVFSYVWHLSYHKASNALLEFQTYALSHSNGPPSHLGAEIVLGKGTNKGSVYFELTGAWYGSVKDNQGNDIIDSILAPFLSKFPRPAQRTRSGDGTYIGSVRELGGGASLVTAAAPDIHDTFYAKSMMIPEDQPLSGQASLEFMARLARDGFDSATNWFVQVELWGGSRSKINAVPANSTAFARRNTLFTLQLYASAQDSRPPFPNDGFTFVDGLVTALTSNMPTNWNYGAYTDYVEDRLGNWEALYYGSHYARLQAIKRQVDPKNIFEFPTSIEI